MRLRTWANAAESYESPSHSLAQLAFERLREMQERGLMRRDIDPASALVSFYSLVENWFLARPSLEKRLGAALPDDSAFLEDLVRVLIRGLRPCEPERAPET